MKTSNELKEKIGNLLKNYPELRDKLLSGDPSVISEVAIIGQKNIPPELVIEAYKDKSWEKLYREAEERLAIRDLYKELCKAYWTDKEYER